MMKTEQHSTGMSKIDLSSTSCLLHKANVSKTFLLRSKLHNETKLSLVCVTKQEIVQCIFHKCTLVAIRLLVEGGNNSKISS
jgi:hypothetical protein